MRSSRQARSLPRRVCGHYLLGANAWRLQSWRWRLEPFLLEKTSERYRAFGFAVAPDEAERKPPSWPIKLNMPTSKQTLSRIVLILVVEGCLATRWAFNNVCSFQHSQITMKHLMVEGVKYALCNVFLLKYPMRRHGGAREFSILMEEYINGMSID